MDLVDDVVAAVDGARRLHRWRLRDGGAVVESLGEPVAAHDDDVRTISCQGLADGRRVAATGSVDGVVRVWDLSDGRCLHHIPVEQSVRVVALAADLNLFIGLDRGLGVVQLSEG
jgi:WD40 repeat protein